ncbi:MAG: phage tail tube protein [Bacteroidaceae bacterium]|nr:phage tail tube protein [Bacteroidaceae bacterium]
MQKGQYIRLLVSLAADPSTVVAAAKQMALHGSAQTEDSSTKDTTGNALEYDVTGQSYDISGSGLILSPSDALLTGAISLNDLEGWVKDQLLYWRICVMEGANNRTIVEEIAHGQGKLTNLKIDAQNKQNATYSYTINGYGPIVPGEDSNVVGD